MARYAAKILGFGDNVADIYEDRNRMYPGGNCVNVSVYAQKFGAERASYMGYFGNDATAEFLIRTLAETGIGMERCSRLDGESGWSRVRVINGDRVFVSWNNGGIRGKTPYILNDDDLAYMKQFDVVHTGSYCFTESELRKIRSAGIPVSFDFSDDSRPEYYKTVLPDVDYAFCSHSGDDAAVKSRLQRMIAGGASLALASRGDRGCLLYDGTDYYEQQAVPVQKLVDTMGAGDSLIAAFLTGFIDRTKKECTRPEAIRQSLAAAAAFASEICGLEGSFGCGKPCEF